MSKLNQFPYPIKVKTKTVYFVGNKHFFTEKVALQHKARRMIFQKGNFDYEELFGYYPGCYEEEEVYHRSLVRNEFNVLVERCVRLWTYVLKKRGESDAT